MSDAAACYDVVVIGGGMSGLEAACELANDDVEVLVVDAAAPAHRRPEETKTARWSTTWPPHFVDVGAPELAGGRSRRWHGVVIRLEPWALGDRAWPDPVVAALEGTTGHPGLYDEVEADLTAWRGSALDLAAGQSEEDLVEAVAVWAGEPARVVPRAVRQHAPVSSPGVGAYTPIDRWTDIVSARGIRGRADLGLASMAVEVLTRRGRAVGVRLLDLATGCVSTIAAGAVLAAAGTFENTRLVAQTRTGRATFAGLHDHLVQGFVMQLPPEALGLGEEAEGFTMVQGTPESRSNLFVRVRTAGFGRGDVVVDVWAMGEQRRGGDVRFAAASPPPWPAAVVPSLDWADEAVLDSQRRWLDRVWVAIAATAGRSAPPLEIPDFRQNPRPFEAALAEAGEAGSPIGYSWPLGTVDHEGGTLPLGSRLDDRGAVPGLEGFYVVGPAVFPRAGAANPSLTTLALARRTARAVLGSSG